MLIWGGGGEQLVGLLGKNFQVEIWKASVLGEGRERDRALFIMI